MRVDRGIDVGKSPITRPAYRETQQAATGGPLIEGGRYRWAFSAFRFLFSLVSACVMCSVPVQQLVVIYDSFHNDASLTTLATIDDDTSTKARDYHARFQFTSAGLIGHKV